MKIDEAIELLEEMKGNCAVEKYYKDSKRVEKAIETVLKDREKLVEKNNHLKNYSDYETICLENNTLQEQMEILQSYYKDSYISKDKIREKIDELKYESWYIQGSKFNKTQERIYNAGIFLGKNIVLQELLKESD